MKKIKKVLFSLIGVIFLSLALTSCSDDEVVTSLIVRGYTNSFTVGDTFNAKGLLATANTNEGEINVSDEVEIDSSMVDMNKPGIYTVVVKYMNIETPYQIEVVAKANEQRLKSLALDTTNVKLNYLIGETFDSSGLGIIATYQNSNKEPDEVRYLTSLDGFDLVVRDNQNNTITGPFTANGEYTVYVTNDTIRANFKVNVKEEEVEIAQAIDLAVENKDLVSEGFSFNTNPNSLNAYNNNGVSYYFGDNLMSLEYLADGNSYYNCYYLENNTLYGYKYNTISGEREIYSNLTNEAINGIAYEIFANSKTYYGAEGLLKGLYDLALENNNRDFGEGMIKATTNTGGTTNSYSFNFGLLEEVEVGLKYYLHKVEVSFTLDDSNFLNNMNVTCNTYVVDNKKTDFTILAKDDVTNTSLFYGADRIIPTGYPSDFPVLNDYSINNCIARLKATAKPDSSLSCSYQISQLSGKRDAINQYPLV